MLQLFVMCVPPHCGFMATRAERPERGTDGGYIRLALPATEQPVCHCGHHSAKLDSAACGRFRTYLTARWRVVCAGMWTRFFPAMQRCLQLVESGAIGTVLSVQADFGIVAGRDVRVPTQQSRLCAPTNGRRRPKPRHAKRPNVGPQSDFSESVTSAGQRAAREG